MSHQVTYIGLAHLRVAFFLSALALSSTTLGYFCTALSLNIDGRRRDGAHCQMALGIAVKWIFDHFPQTDVNWSSPKNECASYAMCMHMSSNTFSLDVCSELGLNELRFSGYVQYAIHPSQAFS